MIAGAERLAVALDVGRTADALALARSVAGAVGAFKVGLELFAAEGPTVARAVASLGPLFLDLKLHDIPNTVERAAKAAAHLGATYLTVHAAGGSAMVQAAARGAGPGVKILAVTVLTSLAPSDLAAIGFSTGVADGNAPQVLALRLAKLAMAAGASGVVCSTREVADLRAALGPAALLVVPGIRPAGSAPGDQQRVGTPAEAIAAGANLLVVGRPIREAAEPRAAAEAIATEIAAALHG